MTKTVIINRRMADVTSILSRWPARKDVLWDAQAVDPELKAVAVHRWFSRKRIPAKYWVGLVAGAETRDIGVTIDDLAKAHSANTSRGAA